MTDTTEQWRLRTRVQRTALNQDLVELERLKDEYYAIYGRGAGQPADAPCQYLNCTDDCTSPDGGTMFHCDKHTDELLEGLLS